MHLLDDVDLLVKLLQVGVDEADTSQLVLQLVLLVVELQLDLVDASASHQHEGELVHLLCHSMLCSVHRREDRLAGPLELGIRGHLFKKCCSLACDLQVQVIALDGLAEEQVQQVLGLNNNTYYYYYYYYYSSS